MARIEKVLVRKGVYAAPQGEFRATPRRLARYERQFNAMRASGIRVPISWGHQPEALPGDARQLAEKRYYRSKFNAGYLDGLRYDPVSGALKFTGDVPGCELDDRGNLLTECTLPDGRKVKSAIAEVSLGAKDWTDGKGRLWKDAIVHVALVPLPVVAGQDGFRALSTDDLGSSGFAGFTLSLANFTHELASDTCGGFDMADDLDAEAGNDIPPPPPDVPPPPPPPEAPAMPQGFAETVAALQALGLHLPADTTPDNFFERAAVASHAILKSKESDDEDEYGGTGDAGASGGGVTEEQRPMMMSLATEQDPVRRKFIEREQTCKKGELLKSIERLKKRGMPVAEANELRERIDGFTLSLSADGEPRPTRIDFELSVWEKALPRKKFTEAYLATHSHEQDRPAIDPQESEEEIKKRAERVSTRK